MSFPAYAFTQRLRLCWPLSRWAILGCYFVRPPGPLWRVLRAQIYALRAARVGVNKTNNNDNWEPSIIIANNNLERRVKSIHLPDRMPKISYTVSLVVDMGNNKQVAELESIYLLRQGH